MLNYSERFLILILFAAEQFAECSTKLANSRQFAKHLQDIGGNSRLNYEKAGKFIRSDVLERDPALSVPGGNTDWVPRQWALYGTWQSGRGVLQWLMLTASYPSSRTIAIHPLARPVTDVPPINQSGPPFLPSQYRRRPGLVSHIIAQPFSPFAWRHI